MSKRRVRQEVVIIASAGGHLREARLAAAKLKVKPLYITYRSPHLSPDTHPDVRFLIHPRRNPFRLFMNSLQALALVLWLRPRVVITTGADVAVPFSILARLFGAKLIYVESGANISSPTLTGKILYHFADLFIVQWEAVRKHFPKSEHGGPLF